MRTPVLRADAWTEIAIDHRKRLHLPEYNVLRELEWVEILSIASKTTVFCRTCVSVLQVSTFTHASARVEGPADAGTPPDVIEMLELDRLNYVRISNPL